MNHLIENIAISDYEKPSVIVKRKVSVLDVNSQAMFCYVKVYENNNGNYGNEITNLLLKPYEAKILFRNIENGQQVYVNPTNGITCVQQNGVWTDRANNIVVEPKLKGDWWTDLIKNGQLNTAKMQQIVENEDTHNHAFNTI